MNVDEPLEHLLGLGETGINLAAFVGDELVLERVAGRARGGPDAPAMDASTVFPLFSVTKGVTALAVHLQAERGLLDYDDPIATHWLQYGRHGKDAITIRHVLTHRAGVPQMPADVTPQRLGDWGWVVDRLAQMEAIFPPGTRNTYVANTIGWLLGEVVRRTDPAGRSFAAFVEEESCRPLGVDAFCSAYRPRSSPGWHSCTRPAGRHRPKPVRSGTAPSHRVAFDPTAYNRPDVHQTCIPAAGGIADARSVARIYSVLANRGVGGGRRLLSEARALGFLEPRPHMRDYDTTYERAGYPVGMGAYYLSVTRMGYFEPSAVSGHRLLCHPGACGSIAWTDLDLGLSVAVCHSSQFLSDPPLPHNDPFSRWPTPSSRS